jgi:hypothetical protein
MEDLMNEVELHQERADTPGWDTKIRCTCGHETASRAEMWKHQADVLRTDVESAYRAGYLAREQEYVKETLRVRRAWKRRLAEINQRGGPPP